MSITPIHTCARHTFCQKSVSRISSLKRGKVLARDKRLQVPRPLDNLDGFQPSIKAPMNFQSYRSDKPPRFAKENKSRRIRALLALISL